jgi:hypothetical protein
MVEVEQEVVDILLDLGEVLLEMDLLAVVVL